jgi:hypothetical protein
VPVGVEVGGTLLGRLGFATNSEANGEQAGKKKATGQVKILFEKDTAARLNDRMGLNSLDDDRLLNQREWKGDQ